MRASEVIFVSERVRVGLVQVVLEVGCRCVARSYLLGSGAGSRDRSKNRNSVRDSPLRQELYLFSAPAQDPVPLNPRDCVELDRRLEQLRRMSCVIHVVITMDLPPVHVTARHQRLQRTPKPSQCGRAPSPWASPPSTPSARPGAAPGPTPAAWRPDPRWQSP